MTAPHNSQPVSDEPMHWEDAKTTTVDPDAYYVVQHNGHEWRDFDLAIMRGILVKLRLQPDWVRGRPEWIAKIVRPSTVSRPNQDGASNAVVGNSLPSTSSLSGDGK